MFSKNRANFTKTNQVTASQYLTKLLLIHF